MPIVIGILVALLVAAFLWRCVRFVRQLRQYRGLVPAATRLRRERQGARILMTLFLVVLTGVAALLAAAATGSAAERAVAVMMAAGGGIALIAALWSPWIGLRIAASLIVIAVTLLASYAAVLLAAGGPDNRGELLPGAMTAVAVVLFVFLIVLVVLVRAEILLWRMERSGPGRPPLAVPGSRSP